MNIRKYQPILETLGISLFAYILHKVFFYFNKNNPKYTNFIYPIEGLYVFFGICSVLIILLLIKVKNKNIDNVGHTFLLITSIKMVLSYALLYPILNSTRENIAIEKINFFIVFALFLAIETIVTIRILNNNQ
jgi:hypothetical protein